jgi:hypothetical protein
MYQLYRRKARSAGTSPKRLQLHTIHCQAANNTLSEILDDKQLLAQNPTKNGEEM